MCGIRCRNGSGRERGSCGKQGRSSWSWPYSTPWWMVSFVALDKVEQEIDRLEEVLMNARAEEALHGIHRLRRTALFIQSAVGPVKDMLVALGAQDARPIEGPVAGLSEGCA